MHQPILLGIKLRFDVCGFAAQYRLCLIGQRAKEKAVFKIARRKGQSVRQIFGERLPKKMRALSPVGRPLAKRAPAAIVEYFGRRRTLHMPLVPCALMSDKPFMQALSVPIKSILDFALPPRCPGCGAVTPDQDRFCSSCWQSMHFLTEPACATCDLPLPFASDAEAQCAACIAKAPRHSGIKAAVAYGEISREIALKLKHGGRIGLAQLIAGMLVRHLHSIPENALLAPVPLHWTRLWQRRYNQSALIARQLSRTSGIEHCPDLLSRTRRTKALGGLSARERAAMVKNAFNLNPRWQERIKGRAIALVDDVYTSGATTDACVATLRKAGAASVTIFCWARVLPAALEYELPAEALT
jgi:ComF family protein